MEIICERIKSQRMKRGMSQQKLADAIGTSQQTVGRWEVGGARPDASSMASLCRVLQVSADYLLGLTDDPTPPPQMTAEEMARWEEQADREAAPMTDAELAAKLPPDMQEAVMALIRMERMKAEAKKKSEK